MKPSQDKTHYDVLVLGAGIAGTATAEVLARRGRRVLLIERFAAAHGGGSSHGDGRIIRYSYPEPVYVAMARRAYHAWAALEAASGETLVERTGSWECGPPGSQQLADLEASFERDGIAYERLNTAQSAERFPHFRLPEGSTALYQEDGGIVRAERAVLALLRLARQAGAEVAIGEGAAQIHPTETGVDVEGENGSLWRAKAVVVAAGGWTASLMSPLNLKLPLTVTREQVAYFPARPRTEIDFGIGGMPTLIDYHDPEQPFYALPRIDVPGVKLGWHHSGPVVVPEGEVGREVEEEILQRTRDYVREHLPGLDSDPIRIQRCLYTNTPDYHFILDRHPALPQVVLGGGFSGHGFKFGPVIGEILAALALDEEPPVDLTTFSVSRFAQGRWEKRRSA